MRESSISYAESYSDSPVTMPEEIRVYWRLLDDHADAGLLRSFS